MNRRSLSFLILGFALFIFTIQSCKKEEEATGIDREMFDLAQASSGFTYYKNSNALLSSSSGSGHSEDFLKTKYNAIAATMLDANGKIIPSSVFPEGSLIVKELYENSTTIGRYAILYKQSTNENADANGWVWGYINADASVAAPASDKGSACISCHLQADNIDYMLMNKYFP